MVNNEKSALKVGEWIKGKSRNGELIIGFIESLDILDGVATVRVVKSDNKKAMGKSIPLLNKRIEVMRSLETPNEEQLLYLIDLALATWDENWFIKLTSKLNSIRQPVMK